MKEIEKIYKIIFKEEVFWSVALLFLFLSDSSNEHISFCLNKFFGIDFCFGCGIGRSISSLLNGEFTKSFNYHFFGLPATAILIHRIYFLTFKMEDKWKIY